MAFWADPRQPAVTRRSLYARLRPPPPTAYPPAELSKEVGGGPEAR